MFQEKVQYLPGITGLNSEETTEKLLLESLPFVNRLITLLSVLQK
jgi:hypothetical protein